MTVVDEINQLLHDLSDVSETATDDMGVQIEENDTVSDQPAYVDNRVLDQLRNDVVQLSERCESQQRSLELQMGRVDEAKRELMDVKLEHNDISWPAKTSSLCFSDSPSVDPVQDNMLCLDAYLMAEYLQLLSLRRSLTETARTQSLEIQNLADEYHGLKAHTKKLRLRYKCSACVGILKDSDRDPPVTKKHVRINRSVHVRWIPANNHGRKARNWNASTVSLYLQKKK